jgi:hypothetical protein
MVASFHQLVLKTMNLPRKAAVPHAVTHADDHPTQQVGFYRAMKHWFLTKGLTQLLF